MYLRSTIQEGFSETWVEKQPSWIMSDSSVVDRVVGFRNASSRPVSNVKRKKKNINNLK